MVPFGFFQQIYTTPKMKTAFAARRIFSLPPQVYVKPGGFRD
jgi:hypothetical protein